MLLTPINIKYISTNNQSRKWQSCGEFWCLIKRIWRVATHCRLCGLSTETPIESTIDRTRNVTEWRSSIHRVWSPHRGGEQGRLDAAHAVAISPSSSLVFIFIYHLYSPFRVILISAGKRAIRCRMRHCEIVLLKPLVNSWCKQVSFENLLSKSISRVVKYGRKK